METYYGRVSIRFAYQWCTVHLSVSQILISEYNDENTNFHTA